MLVHVPKLLVSIEGLVLVVQDQAAQVAVAIDQGRPPLIASLLDEEGPQGDRQPCLWFATGFEVGIKKRELGFLTGAVHEDDLGGSVAPQVFIHLPKSEVPAAKQDRE